ncbi:MAG: hypothetical protein A3I03_14160 [Candidatus Rokubacteria bacterium RIFCSPLOWO2_02_FULL_68_19]|nr:MAG: hypothetical protein A3I03_14160 [Candidatus Rokubacteria bacterium RIFCSPLOWO2_02_FULL_68_19]OGL29223.1 MAG: hypothetical protein A3G97_13000 [Candidatus Rokubacteria bacterium RIFCSPLOWO2_12_FULL_69_21]
MFMLDRRCQVLLPLALALALTACAGRGGIPREPFPDVPVPASFIPYSDQWVRIRSAQADVARLIYMSELDVEGAGAAVRELLLKNGWTLVLTNRTKTPDGYKVTIMDFGKEADTIRLTAREAANATHVELSVARMTRR